MSEQRRFVLLIPRNKKRGIAIPRDFYEYFFDLINLNNFPVSVSVAQPSSEVFDGFIDEKDKWRVTKSIYAFVVELENRGGEKE